jgi:Flp pilus assembly protein TadB
MQQQTKYIVYQGRTGPVGRIVAAIAGIMLAAVSLVLGVFFFLAVMGVALIVGVYVWIKLRPVRRQMREAAAARPGAIEGEFRVVSEREDGGPREP